MKNKIKTLTLIFGLLLVTTINVLGKHNIQYINNGEKTFLFFDDFKTLNPNKWVIIRNDTDVTSYIQNGELVAEYNLPSGLYHSEADMYNSNFLYPNNVIVEVKFKNYWESGEVKPQLFTEKFISLRSKHSSDMKWDYWTTSWNNIGDSQAEDGKYHIVHTIITNTKTIIYEDNRYVGELSWVLVRTHLAIWFGAYSDSQSGKGKTEVDWIRVRKYTGSVNPITLLV